VLRCAGYEVVLGSRPGAHRCRYSIEEAEGIAERYSCMVHGCSESFPSKQGLTNHVKSHLKRDAFRAAEVSRPAPATRQRVQYAGGDACVPSGVTADVPRTLDGTRPPDTGGTSPPPDTREAELRIPVSPRRAVPRIPGGNRSPDTGGQASPMTGVAPRIPAGTRPPDTGSLPLSPIPSMLPPHLIKAENRLYLNRQTHRE